VCDLETIGVPSIFRLIQSYRLDEDVVEFSFELGVEHQGYKRIGENSNPCPTLK